MIHPGQTTIPYKAGGSPHLASYFHIRSAVTDRVYTGSSLECEAAFSFSCATNLSVLRGTNLGKPPPSSSPPSPCLFTAPPPSNLSVPFNFPQPPERRTRLNHSPLLFFSRRLSRARVHVRGAQRRSDGLLALRFVAYASDAAADKTKSLSHI